VAEVAEVAEEAEGTAASCHLADLPLVPLIPLLPPDHEASMNTYRLPVILTVLNFLLLAFTLSRTPAAATDGVSPVLRGRALEIVDDRGRVRASIQIQPANPKFKMSDGTVGYPETVLLRLMSPQGRPNVKLGASKDGSGLGLGGEDDPTYVQILSQSQKTSVKLTNKDGRERVITP
jgi:hypothetical protein